MGKQSRQIQPNPAKSRQIVAKNIVLSGLASKISLCVQKRQFLPVKRGQSQVATRAVSTLGMAG
jgi:hypothetical protein